MLDAFDTTRLVCTRLIERQCKYGVLAYVAPEGQHIRPVEEILAEQEAAKTAELGDRKQAKALLWAAPEGQQKDKRGRRLLSPRHQLIYDWQRSLEVWVFGAVLRDPTAEELDLFEALAEESSRKRRSIEAVRASMSRVAEEEGEDSPALAGLRDAVLNIEQSSGGGVKARLAQATRQLVVHEDYGPKMGELLKQDGPLVFPASAIKLGLMQTRLTPDGLQDLRPDFDPKECRVTDSDSPVVVARWWWAWHFGGFPHEKILRMRRRETLPSGVRRHTGEIARTEDC